MISNMKIVDSHQHESLDRQHFPTGISGYTLNHKLLFSITNYAKNLLFYVLYAVEYDYIPIVLALI